jgi:hypothetical protein
MGLIFGPLRPFWLRRGTAKWSGLHYTRTRTDFAPTETSEILLNMAMGPSTGN